MRQAITIRDCYKTVTIAMKEITEKTVIITMRSQEGDKKSPLQ